jgi:hypothetical protein
MKRSTVPNDWPEHLRAVLEVIGTAMGEKRLHPDLLKKIAMHHGDIIPGHLVMVRHLSGAEALPAGNRYEIVIEGPRYIGTWPFRSGELEQLARAAYSRRQNRNSVNP